MTCCVHLCLAILYISTQGCRVRLCLAILYICLAALTAVFASDCLAILYLSPSAGLHVAWNPSHLSPCTYTCLALDCCVCLCLAILCLPALDVANCSCRVFRCRKAQTVWGLRWCNFVFSLRARQSANPRLCSCRVDWVVVFFTSWAWWFARWFSTERGRIWRTLEATILQQSLKRHLVQLSKFNGLVGCCCLN